MMESIQLAFTDIGLDLLNSTCYDIYGKKCTNISDMCNHANILNEESDLVKDLELWEVLQGSLRNQNDFSPFTNVPNKDVETKINDDDDHVEDIQDISIIQKTNIIDEPRAQSETDILITKIHENLSNAKKPVINTKAMTEQTKTPKKKETRKYQKHNQYALNKDIKIALAKRNSKKQVRKTAKKYKDIIRNKTPEIEDIVDLERNPEELKKFEHNQNLLLLELKMRVDREYMRMASISNKFLVEYEVLFETAGIEHDLLVEYFQKERERLVNESRILMDFIKYIKNHSQNNPKMKSIINTILLLKELMKDNDSTN